MNGKKKDEGATVRERKREGEGGQKGVKTIKTDMGEKANDGERDQAR